MTRDEMHARRDLVFANLRRGLRTAPRARVRSPLSRAMSFPDDDGSASASADSDSSVFVMLDGEGRVFGCGDGMDFSFRSFPNFAPLPPSEDSSASGSPVSLEDLARDCVLVDSPLAGTAATHWLGCEAMASPRCALEELAAAVFAKHTETCDDFDPRSSGAEWWTQTNLAPSGLKAHWDKDENLRVSAGLFVHPAVSTVTYLRAEKTHAPTVVYENLTVPKLARRAHENPADLAAAPECTAVCVSHPVAGKHVAFDGRFLHGVVQELSVADATDRAADVRNRGGVERTEAGPSGRRRKLDEGSGDEPPPSRVTFLVNVWLNHRPKGVKPLPDRVAGALRGVTSKPAAKAAAEASIVPEFKTRGGWGEDEDEGAQSTGAREPSYEPLGDDARYFGWSGDDLEIAGVFPKGLMRAAGAAPSEGSGRFPIGKGGGVVRVVENERAT